MGFSSSGSGAELRHALRTLRRTPGFTTTVVATLGLAIGVVAAVFTVLDQVLLDPLPYAHPERLVYVGDLDRPGIRIAHTSAEAARSAGLPPLEPATAVHEAMLQQAAAFGSPGGWPHHPDLPLRSEWLEWLDPSVRDRAATIMAASQRIPEEVLGPDVMREVLSGFSPR